MDKVKLAIFYHTMTGRNYQMALAAKEAAEAAGAEVRLRKMRELLPEDYLQSNPAWVDYAERSKDVPEADLEDLAWADAYIFGTPTRYGNIAAQMKLFIDSAGKLWQEGKLSNKPVSAFTSAMNPHGGQESTLLALYNVFYHWGAFIVPPGYTDPAVFPAGGNPYGVSSDAPHGDLEVKEPVLEAVRYMTRRVVQVTEWLLKGKEQS
jgi:NAD(P)H dehydrogenase (quinone)